MKIFNKKAFRDYKNFGWRSILIIFILVLSIGGSLAFIYVLLAADPWMESYFDDANHADYVYQLEEDTWINQTQLDGLEDLDEIKDYTGRLFWRTSLKLKGVNEVKYIQLVGLEGSQDKPDVFDYTLKSGKNFNDNGKNISVVIDQDFAEKNDLEKEDSLILSGLNDVQLEISGLCNAPEFLMMTANPEYSMQIKGTMTVGYIEKDVLKSFIVNYFKLLNQTAGGGFTSMIYYYQSIDYNNIAVDFKEGVDPEEGHKAVKDYLNDQLGVNIMRSEEFEEMLAYERFHSNIRNAKSFTTIILIFMLLMGLFITYVIFNRYIYNQKQQLGTLSSFGYTKSDINKYFMQIFLLISAITIPISLIVGYSLGWTILGIIVGNVANLEMAELTFLFLPEIIYIGVGVGVFMISASLFIPVRKVKRTMVSDLIYGTSDSKIFMIKFKKSDKPKNKVSHTLIHRNLLRHKKRLVFTTFAITFSLLIVSATQTVIDSMDYNVNRVFKSEANNNDANEIWDLNIDFQNKVNMTKINNTVSQLSELEDVDRIEEYVKALVIPEGEEDQTFLLIGFDAEDTKMHQFTWDEEQEKNKVPKADDEIVISFEHAQDLDKKVGDEIEFKTTSGEEYTFEIVGVHKELISSGYTTLEAGRKIFHDGQDFTDAVYILLEDGADREEVI